MNFLIWIKKKKIGLLVFVFGSFVKGYFTEESDIDIAILFDKKPNFNKYLKIKMRLEEILNREIDIVVLNDASPIIKMQILKKVF